MGNRINIYVLANVFLMITAMGHARPKEYHIKNDTIHRATIFFDMNQSGIDSSHTGNIKTIALLDTLLTDSLQISCPDSITVFTYTSPEGSSKSNHHLSALRSESVKAYLQQHCTCLIPAKIITYSKGEDWDEFRSRVTDAAGLPDKEEVIALIDYHAKNKDKLKKLLKYLNQGKAYKYISSHIFPGLRRAEVIVYQPGNFPADQPETGVTEQETATETATAPEVETAVEPGIEPATTAETGIQTLTTAESPRMQVEVRQSARREVLVAVKNNLLYDLALAPNVEVEVPLGRAWSVNAEYKSPWWRNSDKHRCYQMLSGGVEGRYWLGNRRKRSQLAGHFLGLYAEGGNYDFQFGGDGYRGKYYVASGLTYGYAKRLGRHLSIEFSLGAGYLTTEYRKYTPYQDALVGVKYGQFKWIGPTKAKISLAWLITTGR